MVQPGAKLNCSVAFWLYSPLAPKFNVGWVLPEPRPDEKKLEFIFNVELGGQGGTRRRSMPEKTDLENYN